MLTIKILIIILLLSLTIKLILYLTIFTGVRRWYYINGKLKLETFYINGKKFGISKYNYESGQLMEEVPYINNKKYGTKKLTLKTVKCHVKFIIQMIYETVLLNFSMNKAAMYSQ